MVEKSDLYSGTPSWLSQMYEFPHFQHREHVLRALR